jgi:tripartite-type tricarboxylate transporter receptor subunit TctC
MTAMAINHQFCPNRNMASAGIGSAQHISGELFKMMTGVNMIHVPYRGAASALTDLIGGQVQFMVDVMSTSVEHIRAGKLRALAVTTKTRSEALPELPTVGDFVRAMRQAAGPVWARHGILLSRSSISSTRRSMQA